MKRKMKPLGVVPQSTSVDIMERYTIIHYLTNNPVILKSIIAPELKGGFARFIDERGIERWISGSIIITKDKEQND